MKSIEEIREALRLFDPYSSDPKYLFTLRAALDELAALREENVKLREAMQWHGPVSHTDDCFRNAPSPLTAENCLCGAGKFNALVRGMQ